MEPVPPDGNDAIKHLKSQGLSVILKYVPNMPEPNDNILIGNDAMSCNMEQHTIKDQ
jgi:hypothetical protein